SCGGGGTVSSRTRVPGSMRSGENTPLSVASFRCRSARTRVTVPGLLAACGRSSKYCATGTDVTNAAAPLRPPRPRSRSGQAGAQEHAGRGGRDADQQRADDEPLADLLGDDLVAEGGADLLIHLAQLGAGLGGVGASAGALRQQFQGGLVDRDVDRPPVDHDGALLGAVGDGGQI